MPTGDRGERVADVVDQVREEGDGAGEKEDPRLQERREPEDAQAAENGLDSLSRAEERAVDETVRVAVPGVAMVTVVAFTAVHVHAGGL
ncbi:MAG: hypothetical protein M5U27_07975 [Gaiella sp.]|nr:hypothetical protein [Gaiella sp.]